MLGEMEIRHGTRGHRPGSLPPEVHPLIDRQREVADLKRLIGGTRLVTLTGPGGAGKTRLALRLGSELQRAYGDGVFLVDLAELADGTVDQLLRSAPGLSVLCTSRQPLGMVGEAVRTTVTPLGVPADTELTMAEAAGSPALTLFADRAAAVLPGFRLTAENVGVVASICRRVDGLPLAIELAVAQLRSRSLAELAIGLGDRLPGLRDTFDWSYGLCSPAERALWARLAVFAGFDQAGATAVCAGGDLPAEAILDTILGLVDKSIVVRDESGGPVRYHLLETVREYGLDRLDPAERTALRRRHRDWYLELAERFDAEWFGAQQPSWAARIRAEYANLRIALGWCLSTPGETAAGARLARALRYHWFGGGALVEGRYWLERALAADPAPTPERVPLLSAYNRILITQMDLAAGGPSTAESLELARRLGDPTLLAQAHRDFAIYLLRCGDDPPAAQAALEEALDRSAALGDTVREEVTMTRLSLAMALLYQGETTRADALCAQCREICVAAGERWCRSHALVASALVAQAHGEPGRATGYLRESLRLREALGDTVGLALAIDVLAGAAATDGDAVRAATLRGAGRRAWHDAGVPGGGSQRFQEQDRRTAQRARDEVGAEAYAAAFQDGWKLSLDEAAAYARSRPAWPSRNAPPRATSRTSWRSWTSPHGARSPPGSSASAAADPATGTGRARTQPTATSAAPSTWATARTGGRTSPAP
ncbi:MAG: hypothetical protein AUI10_13450 [Actinobacteria bacterium 13_2_20CM_2_72_6]|nr:MAG: hypothetical protein AUI10_13450 [Actinobacteria bacterium 13_2_20CM_2_72_6]